MIGSEQETACRDDKDAVEKNDSRPFAQRTTPSELIPCWLKYLVMGGGSGAFSARINCNRKMEQVDVVICGSGSAGLCAATWLARYGVKCKVLERRDGPMKMGQADGVQCRTVEIFESFGVGEELLRDAYHVLEVSFWADEGSGIIKRTGRAADVKPGLSHQPHVILNQARMNALLIGLMRKYNDQDIDYGYNVTNVEVDSASVADHDAHPVTVTAEKDGVNQTFAAKYALVSLYPKSDSSR